MVSIDSLRALDRMPVEVRRIVPEEIPNALNLIHTSIRELTNQDYTPDQIERIVRSYHQSVLSNGIVVVAEHQSKIVGVAKTTSGSYGSRMIEAVFTHPKFVGKGVGRAMLAELESSAYRCHISQLTVLSSVTAVGFYEALEYERDSNDEILGDVSIVTMHKQLMPLSLSNRISAVWSLLLVVVGICGLLYGLYLFMVSLLF